MENVTPPYPPNPELRQPHPGQPLPASSGTSLPAAGLLWLVAGIGLGLLGHFLQFALLRGGWAVSWSEWPMLLSQFLVYAGGLVGAVGAVAIGVRIALPQGRA